MGRRHIAKGFHSYVCSDNQQVFQVQCGFSILLRCSEPKAKALAPAAVPEHDNESLEDKTRWSFVWRYDLERAVRLPWGHTVVARMQRPVMEEPLYGPSVEVSFERTRDFSQSAVVEPRVQLTA